MAGFAILSANQYSNMDTLLAHRDEACVSIDGHTPTAASRVGLS
jgi:hypothetical protein